MEVRIKVRIDGGDDAGATRHDAGTTTTRGSDKQGRRRGGDAATTGRRMRRKDQSTFSATGLSECSSGKLLLVDCVNEDDHGRFPRVHDRSSIHRSGPGPTGAPGAEVPETRKNSYGDKREADMRNVHQGVHRQGAEQGHGDTTETAKETRRRPPLRRRRTPQDQRKTARKKRYPFSLPAALCLYQGLSRNPGSPMQGEGNQERQSVPKA